MAISSYKSFLMTSADGTAYTKVIDIKDFPDLGGSPETLDTTTLSDAMKTSIPGIQSVDALEFKANYTKEDYTKLKALEGKTQKYAVWFGGTVSDGVATPDGSNGKFAFDGALSVHVNGASVNEVVEMTITIMPSTPITDSSN